MTTVAELLIDSLAEYGVTSVWGVVGDALNPVTDAIRREDRIDWIGVRHEEAGAFAASAQAQLTGRLGVCMGTVGPGAIHLLNGLYDAKKSTLRSSPSAARCRERRSAASSSRRWTTTSCSRTWPCSTETVTSIDQLPFLIEQAGNTAIQESRGGSADPPGRRRWSGAPEGHGVAEVRPDDGAQHARARSRPAGGFVAERGREGHVARWPGAREARKEVIELAKRLAAPMVLTLKAKEGLEGTTTTRWVSPG